jgi:ABC-2 type transport system permease protein
MNRSLRTLWIIFKHEFRLYFVSPLVYLIGAVWLFLAGGFFSLGLYFNINPGLSEPSMIDMFGPMVFLMIFIAPGLTMRLVSDELRAGTHELLFTAPIRDWEIILAKWLAVWAVFSVFILATVIFPAILVLRGNPDVGLILTSYLGLWLMAGTTLACGVFASTLTQYQPVAFMIGLGITLFLWVSQAISNLFTSTILSEAFIEIGLNNHYQNLISRAIIDPVDIAYFIGLSAIFLFLSTQILTTRRWSA